MPAPFFHLIETNVCSSAVYTLFWCYLGQIFIKSSANLALKYIKLMIELHFSGTICDEFSEQH